MAATFVLQPAATDADPARLRRLVEEALTALVGDVPEPMRALCGEALGVTDLEGRPARNGGKRLRPLLCLLACEAQGGAVEDALHAALALECVHAFSLVHDDIVDGDRERRGRPSLWAAAGMSLALNAGDALHALACATAWRAGAWTAGLVHGATMSMIEGQHLDLCSEGTLAPTVASWERLAVRKTGALFAAAAAAGAASAGAADDVVESYWELGEALGLAFQAQDDVLGVWGDPRVTGKPAGSDLARRKASLPVACALEAGGAAAEALRRDLANPGSSVELLLQRLDDCDARERVSLAEAGYMEKLRLARADSIPRDSRGAALSSLIDGLAGRQS
ncbi:MAG TPA: polyprenyl synthetase family protein [Candidatus Dormibacteraeota bacterium]|nr:polyprenyl synthetase family protein [Candidatus Dormibacteraeota bacterium]